MKKEDNNQTPRLIRHGYLSNTVYFVPDDLSLTIRVDPKKEKYPRKRKRILFGSFNRTKAIWLAS